MTEQKSWVLFRAYASRQRKASRVLLKARNTAAVARGALVPGSGANGDSSTRSLSLAVGKPLMVVRALVNFKCLIEIVGTRRARHGHEKGTVPTIGCLGRWGHCTKKPAKMRV